MNTSESLGKAAWLNLELFQKVSFAEFISSNDRVTVSETIGAEENFTSRWSLQAGPVHTGLGVCLRQAALWAPEDGPQRAWGGQGGLPREGERGTQTERNGGRGAWERMERSQKAGQQTDVFLELKPVLRRERRWGSLSPDLRGSRTNGIEGISGTRQGLSVPHVGLCSGQSLFREHHGNGVCDIREAT